MVSSLACSTISYFPLGQCGFAWHGHSVECSARKLNMPKEKKNPYLTGSLRHFCFKIIFLFIDILVTFVQGFALGCEFFFPFGSFAFSLILVVGVCDSQSICLSAFCYCYHCLHCKTNTTSRLAPKDSKYGEESGKKREKKKLRRHELQMFIYGGFLS